MFERNVDMTNKENAARFVSKYEDKLSCPICQSKMQVTDFKSIVCTSNHTFDFAKQGYVNMLNQAGKSQYDKALFHARQGIIMDSNLYSVLHKRIIEVMKKNMGISNEETFILDAGCGEGSHLQSILDKSKLEEMTSFGLDISKEGVLMAAKNYKNAVWIVGDLAHAPLIDHSMQFILNILSPANYMEFKRILAFGGLVIKVVPGPNYLKELREALYNETEKSHYENQETTSLFKQHFDLVNLENLTYTKELSQSELMNLVQMSPLHWSAEKERIDTFTNQHASEITVDLDILIGQNKK